MQCIVCTTKYPYQRESEICRFCIEERRDLFYPNPWRRKRRRPTGSASTASFESKRMPVLPNGASTSRRPRQPARVKRSHHKKVAPDPSVKPPVSFNRRKLVSGRPANAEAKLQYVPAPAIKGECAWCRHPIPAGKKGKHRSEVCRKVMFRYGDLQNEMAKLAAK